LPADTFFVQYKVVDIRENTFYQLGCWNKIGYYSCYWGKRTCFEIKVMLKPNIVLLLMFTFKLRLHLQTKVVILNASEKEKQ
jgi:hypothetical protein